jgi:pectate lyase
VLVLSATPVRATPFFFCESMPDAPGLERYQGFGAQTVGSLPQYEAGVGIIHVGPVGTLCDPAPPPTQADLVAAIQAANATPNPTIVFPANQTIWVTAPPPPPLTASNVTLLGNRATIRGDAMPIASSSGALLDIRGHDVIIRDLHLRNGGNDNLRIQGPNAYNIVISHVTSTGAGDDGLSISNRCRLPPPSQPQVCDPNAPLDTAAPHDVTIQFSFFAGNTRNMFIKPNNPATQVHNVSVHHNWLTKQWVRGPFVEHTQSADFVNNLVEDWAEWGVKFANGATGNVAYNLFRQSSYAVELGQLVDPQCRASTRECAYNGNPNCPYVVDDPNDNNQKKGFNFGSGMDPSFVYTNDGLDHTNWYLGEALHLIDGTAPQPFPMPEVFTLHQYGDLRDEIEARVAMHPDAGAGRSVDARGVRGVPAPSDRPSLPRCTRVVCERVRALPPGRPLSPSTDYPMTRPGMLRLRAGQRQRARRSAIAVTLAGSLLAVPALAEVDWKSALAVYAREPYRNRRALLALRRRADGDVPAVYVLAIADAELRARRFDAARARFSAALARGLDEPLAGWARLGLAWAALAQDDVTAARSELGHVAAGTGPAAPVGEFGAALLDAADRVPGAEERMQRVAAGS